MNLFPWQLKGLGVFATIGFIWNLLLSSTFTVINLVQLGTHASHEKSETKNLIEKMS